MYSFKYSINLDRYQLRSVPKEILGYNRVYRYYLCKEIKRYQEEFHTGRSCKISIFEKRLRLGWKLLVFVPTKRVRGWGWLSPTGEISIYISKAYRSKGWGKQMIYRLLNEAYELEYPEITYTCNSDNLPGLYTLEHTLDKINCKITVKSIDI